MSFISDIFAGGTEGVLKGVRDVVTAFKLPPEQQLQYDEAMAKMKADLEMGLEKIAAEDRNSARNREIQTGDSKNVFVLACGITVGFFGILGYMMVEPVPVGAERVIDVMLGSLGMAWMGVISYYFGSSSGSARKSQTIDRLTTEGK
jgi:hypothetical protein